MHRGELAVLEAKGLSQVRAPGGAEFVREGAQVVVAVRPEKLFLSLASVADGRCSVKAQMKTVAYLGDRSHFYVSVDGCEKPLAVAALEVEALSGQGLQRGEAVWLSWDEESLLLLPVP